jgi:hypothetical protein
MTLDLFKDKPQENNWRDHWKDMPEYNNAVQAEPFVTATFKFKNDEDFNEFKELVTEHLYNGERVFDGMQRKQKKTAWYPLKEKASKYEYVDESYVSDIYNK